MMHPALYARQNTAGALPKRYASTAVPPPLQYHPPAGTAAICGERNGRGTPDGMLPDRQNAVLIDGMRSLR